MGKKRDRDKGGWAMGIRCYSTDRVRDPSGEEGQDGEERRVEECVHFS